jgi:hypothetical protein
VIEARITRIQRHEFPLEFRRLFSAVAHLFESARRGRDWLRHFRSRTRNDDTTHCQRERHEHVDGDSEHDPINGSEPHQRDIEFTHYIQPGVWSIVLEPYLRPNV